MSGPEPMPERIYVTLIDAETRKLLAEKKTGPLDTEYVRADLYMRAQDSDQFAGECANDFKAQRDRLAGLIREAIDTEDIACETDWGHKPPCLCEWCVQARVAVALAEVDNG